MQRLRDKLGNLMWLIYFFLPMQFGQMAIPLWLRYQGPDLPGVFYYHFSVNQHMMIIGGCCMLWLLVKEARQFGVHSSSTGGEHSKDRSSITTPRQSTLYSQSVVSDLEIHGAQLVAMSPPKLETV